MRRYVSEAFKQWARYLRYSRPGETFKQWLKRVGERRIPFNK